MKKIWNVINEACGDFLAWIDRESVAFWLALVLSVLGFICAEPADDVPVINVSLFAFIVGFLTVALLLGGSCIVLRKGYNVRALIYGSIGALMGTLACLAIALI